MEFEIEVIERKKGTKSEMNKLRHLGNIPAILYAPEVENEPIAIKGDQFKTVLRHIPKGRLATTAFVLKHKGKKLKAIVKEVQYHTTTYDVLHVDFEKLDDKTPVCVTIPIQYVGEDECAGVKLGGFLRKVMRGVKVKCLPKDIPAEFEINVKDLNITESRRVSDIVAPKNVKIVDSLDSVALVVAKKV